MITSLFDDTVGIYFNLRLNYLSFIKRIFLPVCFECPWVPPSPNFDRDDLTWRWLWCSVDLTAASFSCELSNYGSHSLFVLCRACCSVRDLHPDSDAAVRSKTLKCHHLACWDRLCILQKSGKVYSRNQKLSGTNFQSSKWVNWQFIMRYYK